MWQSVSWQAYRCSITCPNMTLCNLGLPRAATEDVTKLEQQLVQLHLLVRLQMSIDSWSFTITFFTIPENNIICFFQCFFGHFFCQE